MPLESSYQKPIPLRRVGLMAFVLGVADTKAQDAEPRSYSNTPVGLNFLIAGYLYSEGKMAFDPNSVDRRRQVPFQYRATGLCSLIRFRRAVGQVRRDRADLVVRRPGLL